MIKVVKKSVIFGLLFLGLSSIAQAQDGFKVAVLDVQGALFNSTRAQAVDSEIQAETFDDQEKIKELTGQAETLNQQLVQDAATLSEAQKKRISDQIQEIGVQYQFLVQKLQTLVQERRQQFQEANIPVLYQAIQAVVDEAGYDLVLRADAVLHIGDGTEDITAKVIERLNQM